MFQKVDLQKKKVFKRFLSPKSCFPVYKLVSRRFFQAEVTSLLKFSQAGVTPFKFPPQESTMLVTPLHYTTVLMQLVEAQQEQPNCCIKKAKHWSICEFFGKLYDYLRTYYERNFLSYS